MYLSTIYIKFAKSLSESTTGAKKMLNLITGQVSHPKENSDQQLNTSVPGLKQLVHQSVSKSIHESISPIARGTVTVQNFKNQPGSYTRELQFIQMCYLCTVNRLTLLPLSHDKTFMETLQAYMPHWTPECKDKIVYTTITEALSSSIADVEAYLTKLKKDLHIGEVNFPAKVVIAGDCSSERASEKKSHTLLLDGMCSWGLAYTSASC